jgi:hypothetical protein
MFYVDIEFLYIKVHLDKRKKFFLHIAYIGGIIKKIKVTVTIISTMTVTKEIATNNLQDATISVLANTKNNE